MIEHKNLTFSNKLSGFSLLEMAIVLLITSILLGGLMVSLGQSTENARRTTTAAQLKTIQEALYGFAQANGRLPCPATNASSGKEAPIGGGNCTAFHGLLPSATLGLSGSINADSLLLDAWQNPFRYSVADWDASGGGDIAFTSQTGLQLMFDNPTFLGDALTAGDILVVCEDTPCATTLADTIPALVLSMGSNWGTYSSADEQENAGNIAAPPLGNYPITATNFFVSAGYSEDNFDDILLWLSPHILYSRLIKAGQLP